MAQIRREFSAGLGARLDLMRSALQAVAEGGGGGVDPAMAESFYHAAHSLEGTAASFGAHELVDHAVLLAELGRRWVRLRTVTVEESLSASSELERLGLAVEQYRARIERSDAE